MPILNDIINQISVFLSHENDDITDRYHYRYTVISLAILLLLHTSKQYYGDPLQCVTTANTYGSLNSYAHSMCWINGTYRVTYNNITGQIDEPPKDDSTKMYFYQWITFIIIFQCFLFSFPSILWSFAIRLNGFDLVYVCRNVVKKAYLDYYSNNTDWDRINKTLQHVGDHLRLSLLKLHKKKTKKSLSIEKNVGAESGNVHPDTKLGDLDNCFVSGFKHIGSFSPNSRRNEPRLKSKPAFPLYWSYIAIKFMYIANIIIQILFLTWVFKFNYFTYGPVTIASIVSKEYEFDNSFFPKKSICMMHTYNIGSRREHFAYLCSQPMNLLNEIFYFIFWFWLVVLFWLTVSSIVFWLRLLISRFRKEHVREIMNDLLVNLMEDDEDYIYKNTGLTKNESFNYFYRDVCSLDLVFVIDLLAINSTHVVARDILGNLWNEYFEFEPVDYGKTRLPLNSVKFSQIKPHIEQISRNNNEIDDDDDVVSKK